MKNWTGTLTHAGEAILMLSCAAHDETHMAHMTKAMLDDLWRLGQLKTGRTVPPPACEVAVRENPGAPTAVTIRELTFDPFLPQRGGVEESDEAKAAFKAMSDAVAMAVAVGSPDNGAKTTVYTTAGGCNTIDVTRSGGCENPIDPRLSRVLLLHAFETHIRHTSRNGSVETSHATYDPSPSATLRAAEAKRTRDALVAGSEEIRSWLEDAGLDSAARGCLDAIGDVFR